jgi:BirA family biotin operon repressor/biotin-[acetyl-CoA-carboxylase] ligase
MGDALTPQSIHSSLNTLILGRQIEVHEQVGSTNDLVREAGRRGEAEGLVVAAEEQMAGRGRLGRTWVAPRGCCILCSVLLRPRFPTEHAFYLTMAASLAIRRACTRLAGSHPQSANSGPQITIKWPNDILINGRKVCGILSESEFSGGDWAFAVVGFGINANLDPAQLGELQETATSLSSELARSIDRADLLARVLGELEVLYLALQRGQLGVVYGEWAEALETTGRRVTVHASGETVTGQALRPEPDGALIIRLDTGEEKRVLAGDVSLHG